MNVDAPPLVAEILVAAAPFAVVAGLAGAPLLAGLAASLDRSRRRSRALAACALRAVPAGVAAVQFAADPLAESTFWVCVLAFPVSEAAAALLLVHAAVVSTNDGEARSDS